MDFQLYKKINFIFFITALLIVPVSLSFAAAKTTTPPPVAALPPQFLINNTSGAALALTCATRNRPQFLTHNFVDPNSNVLKITDQLFTNDTDLVTCSLYMVGKSVSDPQSYTLIANLMLLPQKIGNRLMVKSYVEDGKKAGEFVRDYKLDGITHTLNLTISNLFGKPNANIPPSQILPFTKALEQ